MVHPVHPECRALSFSSMTEQALPKSSHGRKQSFVCLFTQQEAVLSEVVPSFRISWSKDDVIKDTMTGSERSVC